MRMQVMQVSASGLLFQRGSNFQTCQGEWSGSARSYTQLGWSLSNAIQKNISNVFVVRPCLPKWMRQIVNGIAPKHWGQGPALFSGADGLCGMPGQNQCLHFQLLAITIHIIHLAFSSSGHTMHGIQCAAEVPWRTSRNKPSCCRTEYLGEASHHHTKHLFSLNYKSRQLPSRFPCSAENQVQTPTTKTSMSNGKSAAKLLHLSWEQVHLAALATTTVSTPQDCGILQATGDCGMSQHVRFLMIFQAACALVKDVNDLGMEMHQSNLTEGLFDLLRLHWVCMRSHSLGGKPVWYNVNNESYPTVCEWKDFVNQESSKRPWILTHQSKVRIIRLGTGWFSHCRGIFVERMLQTSSNVHTFGHNST